MAGNKKATASISSVGADGKQPLCEKNTRKVYQFSVKKRGDFICVF